jgi:peroxiredoxin
LRTTRVPTPPPRHTSGKVHFDILAKLLADDRRSRSPQDACRLPQVRRSPPDGPAHKLLQTPAPRFALVDHLGRPWNLDQQLAGRAIVLVFYLGYGCDACVHHLFELNADAEQFHRLGAEVVAISGDPPEQTCSRFAQFGAFVFPVLSDPDHRVARSFAAMSVGDASTSGTPLHATFIIARDGRIRWAHCGDSPWRDTAALLFALASLEGAPPDSAAGETPSELSSASSAGATTP